MSARQWTIMRYLRDADEYVTVQCIAEHLRVSQKTVRNELNAIRALLQKEGLGKIESKPHAGVYLRITDECWEKLNVQKYLTKELEAGNEKMVYTIIFELLKKRNLSFKNLQAQLYASRTMIQKLLPQVCTWLEMNRIHVEKEKGEGMNLVVSDQKERYVISSAFFHLWTDIEKKGISFFESRDKSKYNSEVSCFYAKIFDGFDINGVITAIKNTEKKFGFCFTYEGFQQAQIMISFSVWNIRKNNPLDFFTMCTTKIDSEFDDSIASYLVEELEKYYEIHIPMTEKDYLASVLQVTDIQKFLTAEARQFCQLQSLELCRCTMKMVRLIEDMVEYELRHDEYFVENLFLQLRSMIARKKYGIHHRNPLTKQIRQKYHDIFMAIQGISVFVEKELGIILDEDETSYLTLLLGGAMLRRNSNVNACLVCDSYGIGLMQLLHKKLEQQVEGLKIAFEFSMRDLSKIKNCDCDMIISTTREIRCDEKPVVVVDALLLDYDISAVENVMRNILREKAHAKNLSRTWGSRRKLFRKEFIWRNVKGKDKFSVINMMCNELAEAGYVTDSFRESTVLREKKMSTEIGTQIAFPHGAISEVVRTVIAAAFLEDEIPWSKEVQVNQIYLVAFTPDDQQEMSESVLRFYKNFISVINGSHEEWNKKIKGALNEAEIADILNSLIL